IASGVVFRLASGISLVSSGCPFKSTSRKERLSAVSFTAITQPRSALNEIMSGGRPPLDSPSPRGLIRPAAKRSPTTLVIVGALRPEARTRSALEHDPLSRRSLRTRSAFVWRRSEGLPTGIDSFFNEIRLEIREILGRYQSRGIVINRINLTLSLPFIPPVRTGRACLTSGSRQS